MSNGKKEIKRRRKAMKPTKQSNLHDNKGFGDFSTKIKQNVKKGDRKMKHKQKLMMLGLLCVGMIALIIPQQAKAAGTASNTDITNQATVSYEVGGNAQTPILSNTTTFKVDNKVDLTVAEVSGVYTDVNPNTTDQVLAFTVSNTGNTIQDFALAAAAGVDPFGGTDNFDASNVLVFVEEGTTAGYQVGEDTATSIDELAPYVGPGDEVTVYVVADIPVGQSSGDISAYTLTATARAGGGVGVLGGALTQTAGADTPDAVDIVFADGTGDTDGARDASHSDTDAYIVLSAQLTINKTSTVIRDPFNLDTNPKHIPGAYIQYVISISNAAGAGASATLTTITDTLDNNTAIDPDLIVAATGNAENAAGSGFKVGVGGTSTRAGFPQYFTTTSSVDGVDHDGSATGGTVTATMAIVLPLEAGYAAGELKAGESVTLTFNVIIE
jgi:hypothetical protein